jgi:MFS family permease
MIRLYKSNYLIFAVYSSLTMFLEEPFNAFLQAIEDPYTDLYMTMLYLPWVLKPLFGFLADWLYPFGYRMRGYMVIIGLLNTILAMLCLVFANKVHEGKMNVFAYFCVWLMTMSCMAAADAICRMI